MHHSNNLPHTKKAVFEGVYAASLTPMHADYSCNYEAFANHCKDLLSRACRGVLLFGATGEGSSFSAQERIEAIKNLIHLGVDPKKIIVGIICSAIEDAINMARTAVECHCSAVLIVPPFFYKGLPEEGVIDFYREIIRKVASPNLRIFLYHIPQLTGVPITLNIIRTLKMEFPDTVIGLKESEGNLPFTKQVLSEFPDFKVFVGHEIQIIEAVRLGAVGGTSGIVNAFPELITSLYEHAKDPEKSNQTEAIQNVVRILKNYPLFPAIKALVEKEKGNAWHTLKPPLSPLAKKDRASLFDTLL